MSWAQVDQDLSDMKLTRLLELSALLSADDALGGDFWVERNSFRNLHPALLQNFTRAILESGATFSNAAVPSTEFILRYLVENISRLQDHPQLAQIPGMTLKELNTDALSPMWRQQVRLDGRHHHQDFFRAYATLCHFPDQIQTEVQGLLKSGYVDLAVFFKEKYGCSITTVLLGTWFIYIRYSGIFNAFGPFNPPWLQALRTGGPDMKLTSAELERYVVGATPHLEHLYFTEEQVTNYLKEYLPEDELPALLQLLSAPVETLRDQLRQRPYSEGMAAFAPLPLELKPLLKLPDGRLLVPNMRSFLVGMARLPLMLLSTDPARVTLLNNYGYALEAYAEALTTDRLSRQAVTLVPEFVYDRPGTRQEVKSADLTLLEQDQPVTLVEIKAKRLPEFGIGQSGTAAFTDLNSLITETVVKGQVKAQHLSAVLPVEQQAALTETSSDPPLVVVVYGESVANFDGVFRHMIREPEHALQPHLGHFVALSIAEYEQHLEVACETGESVISLLQQSAEEFASRDELQLTSHAHLGNQWPRDPFVERFREPLLAHARNAPEGAQASTPRA